VDMASGRGGGCAEEEGCALSSCEGPGEKN